jgi:cellulose synthase operon protein C
MIDRLADDLHAASPAVRRQTLERLGTYPPGQVSRYLIEALDDDDLQVRVTAARLLGRGRVREAVPALIGWLAEQEPEVRQAACAALGRMGDDRAVAPLSRVMGDGSADVRQAAVEALAELGTPDVVVPVIGRLGDTHPRVRQSAAEGLGRMLTPEAVVPLVSRLQDPVQPVRIAVIGALARIGDARANGALVQSLRDPSPEVRAAALSALARLHAEEAVVPAVGLLADENEEVRGRAVAALGAIGSPQAVAALVDSLRTSSLAPATVTALVEVGPRAVEPLCEVLRQSSDPLARASALNILVRIGDPAAAPTVITELETRGGLPEISLVSALGAIVTPEGLHPLVDRTDHENPDIRLAALIALSSHLSRDAADPRANQALLDRLEAGSTPEKLVALLLLARTGEVRAVGPATAIVTDGERALEEAEQVARLVPRTDRLAGELASALETGWPLRAAAIRVLGSSGDPASIEPLFEVLGSNRRAPLRHEAALALGQLGRADVVSRLVEMLRSPEPVDRSAVILALGSALDRSPSNDARLALESLLAEGETSLSLRALDALSRSRDPAAAEAIAALMARPEVTLRRKAVEVLGEIGGDRARAVLLDALDDEDPLVRGLAAWGLGKIGGPGVAARLVEALDDRGWSVAIDAAGALAQLADPATGEALCRALDDPHGVVHLEANLLLAASATGAPCTLPRALESFRTNEVPIVRVAAARAIGASLAQAPAPTTDEAAAPDPAPGLALGRAVLRACITEDQSPQVQAACRAALGSPSQVAPRDDWIEFYLYASDGTELRPRARYLLVLPDGLSKAGVTDSNAFAREAPAQAGEYAVQDPASILRSQP